MATIEQQKEAQRAKQRKLDAERATEAAEELAEIRRHAQDTADHLGCTIHAANGEVFKSRTGIPQFRPYINTHDLSRTLAQVFAADHEIGRGRCSLCDIELTSCGEHYRARIQKCADGSVSVRGWLDGKTAWQVGGLISPSTKVGDLLLQIAGAPADTSYYDFFNKLGKWSDKEQA